MMRLQDYFPAGTVIRDRYTISRKLGEGGFAVVFEAHDQQIDRRVAIKIMNLLGMKDDEALTSFLTRFEREAKLAAKVEHPNVMNIHDYGTIEEYNIPYIVMEYLQGHDLEEELQTSGPIAPRRLLPMYCDVLEALGYAHAEGIVHKDLKPSNLFMRYPGDRRESLCIVDFGIAHLQNVSMRLTQTGNILGTPNYIAPEYASEQIVSPALDVYQMGLILIEALTGKSVVDAPEPLVAMFQHVRGELNVPEQLLDCPLGPVLQKALALNHMERYQEAFEFADALRKIDPGQVPILAAGAHAVSIRSHPSRELVGVTADIRDNPLAHQDTMERLGLTEEEVRKLTQEREMAFAPTGEFGSAAMVGGTQSGQLHVSPELRTVGGASGSGERKAADRSAASGELAVGGAMVGGATAGGADASWEGAAAGEDNSTFKVVAGVLVLLICLAIGGVLALSGKKGKGGASQTNNTTAANTAAQTTPPVTAAQTNNTLAAITPTNNTSETTAPETTTPPPKPEPVTVILTGQPAAAEVFEGDKRLEGTTPLTLTFESDAAAARKLTLKLKGYEDVEVEVTPASAPMFKYTLKKKPRVGRPPRNTSSKPKTTPKPKVDPKPKEDPKPKIKIKIPGM